MGGLGAISAGSGSIVRDVKGERSSVTLSPSMRVKVWRWILETETETKEASRGPARANHDSTDREGNGINHGARRSSQTGGHERCRIESQ